MTLSEINIYPIKSARGLSLATAQLEKLGLRYDRRWMVVDENGSFLTQRKHPRMALVRAEPESDHLRITAPLMEPLSVPLSTETLQLTDVQIWENRIRAASLGNQASDWFSTFLGFKCQLVYNNQALRPVNPKYAVGEDHVSFADAFPLMLISEASLQDLNQRLDTPIPMNRFRPNLVIRGCQPYEEDTWKEILVGGIRLHVVKPCARCVIPTVDQNTAVQSKEPLRTLTTYRERDGKVLFGQNIIHGGEGVLNVGDSVEVLSWR